MSGYDSAADECIGEEVPGGDHLQFLSASIVLPSTPARLLDCDTCRRDPSRCAHPPWFPFHLPSRNHLLPRLLACHSTRSCLLAHRRKGDGVQGVESAGRGSLHAWLTRGAIPTFEEQYGFCLLWLALSSYPQAPEKAPRIN